MVGGRNEYRAFDTGGHNGNARGAKPRRVARCGTEPLALYDREKCIQILVAKGSTYADAVDYFCYNVEGCYAGPHTPFIASFNLDPVGVPIFGDEFSEE